MGSCANGALMNSEDAEPALELVDVYHHHMGDDMRVGITRYLHRLGVRAFTLEERRWVAFLGIRHQTFKYLQ